MKILGISAYYHDAAAALICDGEIIAAAQEERFTRIKHDASFPFHAIKFCLEFAGYELSEIDAIAFYDKPLLKFERLLETYYAYAPKGLHSFIKAMPIWIKEKIFMKKMMLDELKKIGTFNKKRIKLIFPEHHLSHAASAFYPSGFEESAILTMDGVGEWATASICSAIGNKITVHKELYFPDSLGLLYSAFTYYCGFKVNSGEYKLMGLAPYGNINSAQCENYIAIIKHHLIDLKEDGSFSISQQYFNYTTGLSMTNDEAWAVLFGMERRLPESIIKQEHCNLALAIQVVTEEIVLKMALEAKKITGLKNLCMAGGVALNCVANAKLDSAAIFENIFIQPAAGDAGAALGAAYAAHCIYYDRPLPISNGKDRLMGSFLGPSFSNEQILKLLKKSKAPFYYCEEEADLVTRTATLIEGGSIVGWFQGRMEFGPRALGARSILADPRNPEIQRRINLNIKFREDFRPFAPSVMLEDVANYFNLQHPSPYMLLVATINEKRQNKLPPDFHNFDLTAKLNFKRSDLPAITHIDFSARIQTVDRNSNPLFWKLLEAYKHLTGYSVLVNTSFNRRGEPMVNTPLQAYDCFMETEMDFLIMGNYILDKRDQPVREFQMNPAGTFKSD